MKKTKNIIFLIIGAICIIIALYYLVTAVNGTISLITKEFNENEKGRLTLLLIVNYFIVTLFSVISFITIKKGLKK